MANFAKISEENVVLEVVVVNDSDILDAENKVDETLGQQYLETHANWPANLWILANDGEGFRGNVAGPGSTWDSANQIFWPEKPHASWVKDISTASWKSPLGDMPELTEEQNSQNTAKTHLWEYYWDEDAYQSDNSTGWKLKDYRA